MGLDYVLRQNILDFCGQQKQQRFKSLFIFLFCFLDFGQMLWHYIYFYLILI